MIVPEGQTIHIEKRVYKAGKEIPKHLEAKLKKTQKKDSQVRPDIKAKPGSDSGKK